MTPLQKRRHSTMRQGRRRSTQLLTLPQLSACRNCKALIRPHRMCPSCGFYNGKKVK